MGMKDVILATILVFSIITHVSNAKLLLNSRKLAASSSNQDPNVSPTGSPSDEIDKNPNDDQLKNSTPPSKSPIDKNPNDDQMKNSPKEEVKDHGGDTSKEKVKKDENIPKNDVKSESCDGIHRRCEDEKAMIACIKSFNDVSKAVVLLIQNKGENGLKVDVTIPSTGYKQQVTEIPKLQTKQVNISLANIVGNEIKLNAGNGYCVLHTNVGAPVLKADFFQWSPSYSKFVRPVYGAYLILLITLITGGVCAICWFTKRKRTDEVPYQELEMSMPESASVENAVEGWDEDWDDDWDDEKAVKPPGPSISANGLTSRTPVKGD
ncbi:hypothetical protein RND81_01G023400 [Saponaria officinalis]|uniref:DUF7356 domain-containing protein n=1 Tax=Saponaria officinalis TaxID=3572 RepID=A0AAW1N5M8_SAPOF